MFNIYEIEMQGYSSIRQCHSKFFSPKWQWGDNYEDWTGLVRFLRKWRQK